MNNHNIRYRELMARASRVPNFDYSMLERPSSEEVGALAESIRSRKTQRTQTRRARAEEDNTLYYCTPCDRYFLSAEELALVSRLSFSTTPLLLVTSKYCVPVASIRRTLLGLDVNTSPLRSSRRTTAHVVSKSAKHYRPARFNHTTIATVTDTSSYF